MTRIAAAPEGGCFISVETFDGFFVIGAMEQDQLSGCDDRPAETRANFALPANGGTFRWPGFRDVRA